MGNLYKKVVSLLVYLENKCSFRSRLNEHFFYARVLINFDT